MTALDLFQWYLHYVTKAQPLLDWAILSYMHYRTKKLFYTRSAESWRTEYWMAPDHKARRSRLTTLKLEVTDEA